MQEWRAYLIQRNSPIPLHPNLNAPRTNVTWLDNCFTGIEKGPGLARDQAYKTLRDLAPKAFIYQIDPIPEDNYWVFPTTVTKFFEENPSEKVLAIFHLVVPIPSPPPSPRTRTQGRDRTI